MISSEAQRAMFEKASTDKEYAASRGISQELAREKLLAHAKAGGPKLPDRVNTEVKPKANAKRPKLKIFGIS